MKVSIDTNTFIAINNEEEDASFCEKIVQAIEKHELSASVSTIVIAEMLVGFYSNNDEEAAEKFLKKIKDCYEIVPISIDIAQQAAKFRADYKVKLPDALIYACALASQSDYLISNDNPLSKKDKRIISSQIFIEQNNLGLNYNPKENEI